MSEEEKTTYALYRGPVFALSGSRDTINLYLRICLDRWEDIILADKRKAILMEKDGYKKGEILKEFGMAKDEAFKEWYAELRLNRWEVKWVEDEVNKYQAADHFFLGVKNND